MPGKVARERARRGAGRGILGNAHPGREHAGLPARARAREAVEAERGKVRERREIGAERRDGVLARKRDVDVLDTVVVDLDGELRALDAEGGEELALSRKRLDRRDVLRHPAEDDPGPFALERDRDDARLRLEPDLRELERAREHERGAEHGVSGERKLAQRREDPERGVALPAAGVDEHRLGEVELARERLQVGLRDLRRVSEDRKLVPGERTLGEDVRDHEAVARHARSKPARRSTVAPRLSSAQP